MTDGLEAAIDAAWEARATIDPATTGEVRHAMRDVYQGSGNARR